MAQAATPGGLELPCSPKQALALYQHLFQCPAGLGQLRAALQQVQEGQACPSGLELPTVLLQMERSRRAQEQLLWDLELLTGAGLGLFWPPRARCAWSQCSKPRGRPGGDSETLMHGSSRLCSSPQAGDTLSQSHQFPEGWQAADPSAPDRRGAGSGATPRWERPGVPAEPTPGHLHELDPITSSSFGEPGNSEFKNLVQKEERGQAEPTTQGSLPLSSGSLQRRKIAREASGPSGLPSQGLPESQDPPEGLGWSLDQDRAELQKLLGIEIPQSQREKTNQRPSGEATQALRQEISGGLGWETLQGENKDVLQDQKGNGPEGLRKETPQGRAVQILQSAGGGGQISPACEVAQGEMPTQPQEEELQGIPRDLCRSLGEQMPQPAGRESPGPQGSSTQMTQDKTKGQRPQSPKGASWEGALAPLPPPQLPGPRAVMLESLSTGGSEQQECPTALPGHPGLVRNLQGLQGPAGGPGQAELLVGEATGVQAGSSVTFPGTLEGRKTAVEAPKASKAAWPGSPGGEKAPVGVSAAQQETALQRLLELHSAARRRQQQDRQLQRLRVLERLCIARNRHSRVHPLGLPPSPAQFLPQDVVEQRRALREQLEQMHQKRTGQLRALGARNTQNFQQLLCPSGAEKPTPGEEHSPPCNHR